MSDAYNGWMNRETWALALHMANDQSLDELCQSWAAEAVEADELSRAADSLRSWAEELWELVLQPNPYDEQPGSWAGLLVSDVGSLWRVDYREIMDGYIHDAKQNAEEL